MSFFDLLDLVWYSLYPSMLLQMAIFHSFLCLNNIPLYLNITFSFLVCLWTLRLLLVLAIIKYCCYEHWGACIFLHYCFHFFWIYTQEWDCYIIWLLYFGFKMTFLSLEKFVLSLSPNATFYQTFFWCNVFFFLGMKWFLYFLTMNCLG